MKLKGTAITEAFINHVLRIYTGKMQEVSQEQINAETQLKLRQVEIDELLEEREALQRTAQASARREARRAWRAWGASMYMSWRMLRRTEGSLTY